MKKIIMPVLFLLITAASYAQDFEIKGGANFSNLYISEVHDENMKIGFHAGVAYKKKVLPGLFLQPELLYSLKGAQVHYKGFLGLSSEGIYKFNLGYLEVPVLARIQIGSLHITAGPYVSMLLHANIKDVDDSGNINDIENLDRDDFSTFDYGWSGGLGFNSDGYSIGLRYNKGLINIAKEGEFGETALKDGKNSVLQAYLSFSLN
ncbi:MAG: porin family protein [Candidatus Cyclobacteriaceae bacterium M2_1C_046]